MNRATAGCPAPHEVFENIGDITCGTTNVDYSALLVR